MCYSFSMNEHLRPASLPHTTQAADGLPRRRFSVAEMRAMAEAGILDPDERFELIGGEAVPMNPKGIPHERIKVALLRFWMRAAPDNIGVIPETTFTLSDDTFLEPDITVYPIPPSLEGLNGSTALLCVEVSDSSLAYDRGRKAGIYASFGVREYWSINATTLETRVYRDPAPNGYATILEKAAGDQLVPLLVPSFRVTLGALALP
jgi:Uma2 family endonuclease